MEDGNYQSTLTEQRKLTAALAATTKGSIVRCDEVREDARLFSAPPFFLHLIQPLALIGKPLSGATRPARWRCLPLARPG